MKIKCIKCGKERDFKSIAQIWTEGWNPMDKNTYICDTCPRPNLEDELDLLSDRIISIPDIEETPVRPKIKKNID